MTSLASMLRGASVRLKPPSNTAVAASLPGKTLRRELSQGVARTLQRYLNEAKLGHGRLTSSGWVAPTLGILTAPAQECVTMDPLVLDRRRRMESQILEVDDGYEILDAIVQANLKLEWMSQEQLDGIVTQFQGQGRRVG